VGTKQTKIAVTGTTSKYERSMRDVRRINAKTTQKLKQSWKSVKTVMTGVVGKIAAVAGIGGLGLLAKNALTTGDVIHKMNIRLGISTETLSELEHVSNLSGVAFQTTAKSYQKMQENISDAATGLGTAKNSIEEMGLDIAKLHALSPEKQFEAIADAMTGITNQSDKVRIATDIFGGRGVEMLQIMDKGAEGIAEMRDQAERLGMTLSQDAANKIAGTNDAIARLTGSIRGTALAIVADLSPQITEMVDWFAKSVPAALRSTAEGYAEIYQWIKKILGMYNADHDPVGYFRGAGVTGTWGDPVTPGQGAKGASGAPGSVGVGRLSELAAIQEKEMAEKELAARSIIQAKELAEEKLRIEIDSMNRSAEIEKRSVQLTATAQKQKLAFYEQAAGQIAGTFLQISQAGGKQSEKAFRIYQGFAIAQAYMSGALAYVKTLAEPALPWPGNVAMAKIIAGITAVQIGMIAAAKPPSYDEGGISTRPGIYHAGVPEAHIPLKGGAVPVTLRGGGGSGGQSVNIDMRGSVFQDQETLKQSLAAIATEITMRVAPSAVKTNYDNDGIMRQMVRGRV